MDKENSNKKMEIQTRVDGRCVKEYCKKHMIVWLILLCISVIYCAAFIVGFIVQREWNTELGIAIIVGILTLVLSLVFFIRIKKAIKMADDHAFDAFYEFNEDCFYRKAKVNDEQVSEAKINYSDITCYKVSKSYIYLVLFSKNYYPVDKDDQLEKFLISKNIVRK